MAWRRLTSINLRSLPARNRDWARLLQALDAGLAVRGRPLARGRYLLRFPFWGDESFICLNLIDQTYLGLTGQLRCSQVAHHPVPVGRAERLSGAGLVGAGPATGAVPGRHDRPVPVLAAGEEGSAAPGQYPGGRFPGRGHRPVTMGSNIKPYSLDLCMSTLLLLLAVNWLSQPERLRWLILLALAVPFALLASYPTLFVAGSISVVLLPAVWKQTQLEGGAGSWSTT